jgi:hypothetical protein
MKSEVCGQGDTQARSHEALPHRSTTSSGFNHPCGEPTVARRSGPMQPAGPRMLKAVAEDTAPTARG